MLPTADHAEPDHRAIFTAETAPAAVNDPPTYSFGPEPSSWTAIAATSLLRPDPTADQEDPFHFAMLLTATVPASVKDPPTNSAGPEPSSKIAIASTIPLTPGSGNSPGGPQPGARQPACAA